MRNQAEKILQMAALEEGDFELKCEDHDVHVIIREAVDNIALQVEARQGRITCSLEAENHTLRADRVHFSNIIYNLLDNANKYSPEIPKIYLKTWNDRNGIILRVEDEGRGILEEHLKLVFKKYYRVSSGNIHDVKGFGLGLSYVKLMVEAHGGEIRIFSKFGVETQVELFFPYQ